MNWWDHIGFNFKGSFPLPVIAVGSGLSNLENHYIKMLGLTMIVLGSISLIIVLIVRTARFIKEK